MISDEAFLLVIQFLGGFVNCGGLAAGDWYLFAGLHIDVFTVFPGFCPAVGGALDLTGHFVGLPHLRHLLGNMEPDGFGDLEVSIAI